MEQTKWKQWIDSEKKNLPETNQQFLDDAQLVSVGEKEVSFFVKGNDITFKKLSPTSWTMPSTLFVPYGSLTSLFAGFNVLIEENAKSIE